MAELIDIKDIEIAVIGESMAGKTTWITSMFSEEVNCDLRQICLDNTEGQTKIKTYYKLVKNSNKKLYLDYIEFEGDSFEQKICNKQLQVFFELGIITKEVSDSDIPTDNGIVHIDLFDKDIDISTFFEKVINNKDIAESGVVNCVSICGRAHSNVCKIMESNGIETVTIRDTRGLMDETEDFYKKKEKLNNKEKENGDEFKDNDEARRIFTSLLADRGILGTDGCVFMTQGGNALNKAEKKNVYGFLFETILSNMPSFLVARSTGLNYVEFDINQYSEFMEVDEQYKFKDELKKDNCCRDYVCLLKEFGLLNEDAGLKNQIMKQHYKQMLIPDIDPTDNDDIERYIAYSHASLSMIIEELVKYKNELNIFMKQEKELPEQLRKTFLKLFSDSFKKNYFIRDDGKMDTRLLSTERVEEVAELCLSPQYYGGLVGVRGGLTTYITGYGKTGKYAIALLESAYEQFEKMIEGVLKAEAKAEEVKIKTYIYLKRISNNNCFSYASTNTMFKTRFLKAAWSKLQNNNSICKDLDKDNSNALKIVESILYDIIDEIFIKSNDDGEKLTLLD